MAETKDFANGGIDAAIDQSPAVHGTDSSSGQDLEKEILSSPIEAEKPENDDLSKQHRHRASVLSEQSVLSGMTDMTEDPPLSPLEEAPSNGFDEVTHIRTTTSIGSSASRPPDYEVVFDENDPENPRNWSFAYRGWVIFSISFTTWVVVLYSTSYTAAIPGVMAEFGVEDQTIATLGVTTYLLGLACGSLLVAPASELWGRRPVYIICMTIFTILVIPCCLATSIAEIIVVRFFGAVFGAVMVSNAAGTVADISTDETRALVMSIWAVAPMNGPVTGPIIGGFVYQYLGWRWDMWLILIMGGAGAILMMLVAETYTPTVLMRKTARLRKENDDERYWCRYDTKVSLIALMKVSLLRPFELAFKEPILWFFNLWISLIYAILYLCFVAYPIVFTDYRGWSSGISGLAFLGIGIGTMIAICCEPYWRKIINRHHKDPVTGKVPPEAQARIMIIGSILCPIGQLVFSWTCLPTTIHWAVPIAFGIPFGCGNTLSFIYGSNYLAGAYGIYAASALAGNAVTRSILGGVLPLAGPTMYATLTPQWAGTLLGLLEVCMIPIPLVFYRYGEKIRAKSPIIRKMREDQEKNENRVAKAKERKARKAAKAAAAGNNLNGVVENTGSEEADIEKGGAGVSKEEI